MAINGLVRAMGGDVRTPTTHHPRASGAVWNNSVSSRMDAGSCWSGEQEKRWQLRKNAVNKLPRRETESGYAA
jgi:hypothetical protein